MSTDSRHFETLALHGGNGGPIRRPARSRCRSTNHLVPVQRYRPRRPAVRAGRTRPHLLPRHQPDPRRARTAHRRARGRRRGPGGCVRAGGVGLFGAQPCQAGDNIVELNRSLRRHLGAVRRHAEAFRHGDALRRSSRPGEFPPRHRCAHHAPITPRPCPTRSWMSSPSRGGSDRPQTRRTADHRQHRRTAARSARSSTARRPSSIRPPSISAATAPRLAA